MKKILFSLVAIVSFIGVLHAQNQDFIVTDLEGVEYEDNSIHAFNVHGTFANPLSEAKLHLVVENQGSESIKVFGQILELTNTDGTLAQFCFGNECYNPIYENGLYPSGGVVIAPGANQGLFDYFINLDSTSPVEYKFRFFQGDENGDEIPNTTFTMTYRYDENLGISEVTSIAIADVYPTVAKGSTNVNLQENASVNIINVQGKLVRTQNLKSGKSTLDLSGLSAGVYFIKFNGDSGKSTTTRIVVK